MALDGNGFFMVEESGQRSLMRAGNFRVASNGNLVTQDGQLVLGYPAVNQSGNAAKATQNFSVSTNLDLGAAAGTTFSSRVQVFDSLGQQLPGDGDLQEIGRRRQCLGFLSDAACRRRSRSADD
jgi:flagellar hook protein FlgE